MTDHQPNWDDDHWLEATDSKSSWARGCRWLQSWWRETQLGQPAGAWRPVREGETPRRTKPVASMLPLSIGWDANYLTDDARHVAERLGADHAGGLVDEDRLRRNLLASQPACLNLFAPLAQHPDVVRRWLTTAVPSLPGDLEIDQVLFEWAPPPAEHFGGGSAFDAFITYRADGQRGFVGIETKYAEHLPSQAPKTIRQPYLGYTQTRPWWRPGAVEELLALETRQFWLNTLLAQSLVERGSEGFDTGTVIVVSCAADRAALDATVAVAAQQTDAAPEAAAVRLQWSSYEDVLAAAEGTDGLVEWCDRFRRRYLDFTPVAHKLDASDPRLHPIQPRTDAHTALQQRVTEARAVAERVLPDGSVIDRGFADSGGKASLIDVLVAAERLAQATDALKASRQRLA